MDQVVVSKQGERQLGRLLDVGRLHFPFLPWHTSEDPYVWLVAELLLRRTTRTAAARAFFSLIRAYPSPGPLAQATVEAIKGYVGQLGLGDVRSRHLLELARALVREHNSAVPDERAFLLQLPGVGPYVADAVLLHAFRRKALPLDAASQRVVRRLWGLAPPVRTRHVVPEKDAALLRFREVSLGLHNEEELQYIHFGLLVLSWESCRRYPKCGYCPLRPACLWRARTLGVEP